LLAPIRAVFPLQIGGIEIERLAGVEADVAEADGRGGAGSLIVGGKRLAFGG